MRVAQELAREQDEVRLALRQDVVRLLRRRDHSHGAHDNVRVCLLDRLRERNLQERHENVSLSYYLLPPVGIPTAPYLVPRHDGNLLRGPVPPGAHVDQVDPELLQLAGQQDALLDAPLQPLPGRVLLRAFGPVRGADPHEKRLLCPDGADGLDDAEKEARAILEGLPTVSVGTRVRERREEGMEEVAVGPVKLYKVDCMLWSARM